MPMPITLLPFFWPERAFFSSQLNIAAPLSSASFRNALVTGPWSAPILLLESGALILRICDSVDAQLARRLVDHRLDRGHQLVLAGAALRSAQWRVGQHRDRPEAHRGRLIHERQRIAGGAEIAAADVGPFSCTT